MNKNVTWIDENENDLGEVSLDRAHAEGLLHRISVIYLINDQRQILVQKRDDGRLDHSAAGHVEVKESYLDAAERELNEELGVANVTLKEIGDCISKEIDSKARHKYKVFLCLANPGQLSSEEVQAVFWADPKETWQDMVENSDNKKYCSGFKATLELLLKEFK